MTTNIIESEPIDVSFAISLNDILAEETPSLKINPECFFGAAVVKDDKQVEFNKNNSSVSVEEVQIFTIDSECPFGIGFSFINCDGKHLTQFAPVVRDAVTAKPIGQIVCVPRQHKQFADGATNITRVNNNVCDYWASWYESFPHHQPNNESLQLGKRVSNDKDYSVHVQHPVAARLIEDNVYDENDVQNEYLNIKESEFNDHVKQIIDDSPLVDFSDISISAVARDKVALTNACETKKANISEDDYAKMMNVKHPVSFSMKILFAKDHVSTDNN